MSGECGLLLTVHSCFQNFLQNVLQYHLPLHDMRCEGLEDLPWEIKTLAIVDCIESSEVQGDPSQHLLLLKPGLCVLEA